MDIEQISFKLNKIFFITEETEIIGKETEKAMYSVSNSISGIIMVIMIISFRDKEHADHTDTRKRMIAHPLLSSPPLGRG